MRLLTATTVDDSCRIDLYRHHIENAVQFLAAVQDQVPLENATGYGGLGYGFGTSAQAREQRLDATGHAINALLKVQGLMK